MSLEFDVFWSFRSPYSYLAASRLAEIQRDYEVVVNVRPVYPIAVRAPGFFKKVNPLWPPYVLRDCARLAEMRGLPFAWPDPDPIVQNLETLEIAAEQPYIHRLTRLGVAAAETDHGVSFIDEVSRLLFGGTQGWDQGDHLVNAAARAGLDLAELEAAVASDPQRYEATIEQNEADQKRAGHWGVPLMVFRGEPFFGQDRLDALVWRMQKAGMAPSASARESGAPG